MSRFVSDSPRAKQAASVDPTIGSNTSNGERLPQLDDSTTNAWGNGAGDHTPPSAFLDVLLRALGAWPI